jgi:hypothetical protein
MWKRNDDFIEGYVKRAGVSAEVAAKVADDLCWLFCKDMPVDIDLNNYLDANLYEEQIEDLATAEKRIEELEANVEKLTKDLDRGADKNFELTTEIEKLRAMVNDV